MTTENSGGYLIPEEYELLVIRDDSLSSIFRSIGQFMIDYGVKIKMLGFKKKKIYPHKELLERMEQMKALRK